MLSCPLCLGPSSVFFRDNLTLKEYFHCPICDLRFLHPASRLSFAAESAHYAQHRNDVHDPRYRAFVSPLTDLIQRSFKRGSQGLEYGAGPGPVVSQVLSEADYAIARYDPIYWNDPQALKRRYDFIVACEVVEHFFHPLREFQKLYDLLEPDGMLAIMTLLFSEGGSFSDWYYRIDPTHVVFYSEKTFTWIKEYFGFLSLETDAKRVVILLKEGVRSREGRPG